MTESNQLRASTSLSCSSFEMLSESLEDPEDNAQEREQLMPTNSVIEYDSATGTESTAKPGQAEDHLGFAQPGALPSDQATLECMTGDYDHIDANTANQLGNAESGSRTQVQADRPSRTADLRKPTPLPQTCAANNASCTRPRSRLSALALGALTAWMILMSVILTAGAAKYYHSQQKHAETLAQIAKELVDARLANLTLPGSSMQYCPGLSIAEYKYKQEQAVILQNIQAAIGNLSQELHQTVAETASEIRLLEQLRETLEAVLKERTARLVEADGVKDVSPSTTEATEKGNVKQRGLKAHRLQVSRGQNIVAAPVRNLDPYPLKNMELQQPDDAQSAVTNKARNQALVSLVTHYRNKLRAMSMSRRTTSTQEKVPAVAANITTRRSHNRHLPVMVEQTRGGLKHVASTHMSSAVNAVVSKSRALQAASQTVWPAITHATNTAGQHVSTMADKAVQHARATTAMLHSKAKEAKKTTRKQLLPLHLKVQQLLAGLQAKAARARQWVCKAHTVVDSS